MKKIDEQSIRDAYNEGELDEELYEIIDRNWAVATPSEILAEWTYDGAMAWALEKYIENAKEAWLEAAIAEREDCYASL